ncbi:aminoglycoside phosphotransferase family protein [Streptomyces purpurogeneiscleroticus]|uniref:aminoglycoside phosphotransferase family protein n=1 Tax=Streptomyces purpurogeneiscleroticus TaxID=68259 RepID=UPI001CBE4392|nr:aminoglycoside phosphotransferase family protein [Streptomyces purpurogeneiscleroticus]MBZ4017800.1 phosphotransferase [Streptomyces purpurogeneiscleroticus]
MQDGGGGIDVGLVRRLVGAQFPRWAGLGVEPVDSAGTSNAMYRLGGDIVVRLPRTAGSAEDVAKEHEWLPRLAPRLPVAVPVPLGKGVPGEGYPWHWSVYRWLPGRARSAPGLGLGLDAGLFAKDLAEFVGALRRIDTAGGPPSYRSEPLAARDAATRGDVEALRGVIDTETATAAWEEALRAPAPDGPAVWIHADLQPGNVLVEDGRLSAVIDFGCLGLGDAAVDLLAAWYLLPVDARAVFRTAVAADDAAWARGRGWALSVALAELRYYRVTNPVMAAIARHVIGEIVTDHARRHGGTGV